jgi:hypothetical protein
MAVRLATLGDLLRNVHRNRDEIEVTVGYRGAMEELPETMSAYASMGVDRLLCGIDRTNVDAAKRSLDELARYAGAAIHVRP